MAKVALAAPAPDFTLKSTTGQSVTLSSFQGKSNVILVFNRGFQ